MRILWKKDVLSALLASGGATPGAGGEDNWCWEQVVGNSEGRRQSAGTVLEHVAMSCVHSPFIGSKPFEKNFKKVG